MHFAGYDMDQLLRVANWLDRANFLRFNERIPEQELDDFFALFWVKNTIAVQDVLRQGRMELAKKRVQDAVDALEKLESEGLGKHP